MSSLSLSTLDTGALESQLRIDRQTLTDRIREQLHRSDDPALMALANHMTEVDDGEVADLFNDTDIAILGHELAALRDIELALRRIDNGTYGNCADCGEAIEPARLTALPATRRCLRCKAAFEKRRGIVRNPVI
jgi:RNA polymerase-binding transcription factor DksA